MCEMECVVGGVDAHEMDVWSRWMCVASGCVGLGDMVEIG